MNGSMFTYHKITNNLSDAKPAPMEEAIWAIDFVSSCESGCRETAAQPMQVVGQFSHPPGQVFQRSRRTRSCPADRHQRMAQRFLDKARAGALVSPPCLGIAKLAALSVTSRRL